MRIAPLLVCLLACAVASAEDISPADARLLAVYDTALEREQERVRGWISGHGERLRSVRDDDELSPSDKRAAIARLADQREVYRQRLESLRQGEALYDIPAESFPPMRPDDAEPGDIGTLRYERTVRFTYGPERAETGTLHHHYPARVRQVVDDATVLIAYRASTARGGRYWIGPFWIQGIDASGMSDGDVFGLDEAHVYRMIGTESYQTAGAGQKTVPAFEVVDLSELQSRIRSLHEQREARGND